MINLLKSVRIIPRDITFTETVNTGYPYQNTFSRVNREISFYNIPARNCNDDWYVSSFSRYLLLQQFLNLD